MRLFPCDFIIHVATISWNTLVYTKIITDDHEDQPGSWGTKPLHYLSPPTLLKKWSMGALIKKFKSDKKFLERDTVPLNCA
jgi:hypothetical protein